MKHVWKCTTPSPTFWIPLLWLKKEKWSSFWHSALVIITWCPKQSKYRMVLVNCLHCSGSPSLGFSPLKYKHLNYKQRNFNLFLHLMKRAKHLHCMNNIFTSVPFWRCLALFSGKRSLYWWHSQFRHDNRVWFLAPPSGLCILGLPTTKAHKSFPFFPCYFSVSLVLCNISKFSRLSKCTFLYLFQSVLSSWKLKQNSSDCAPGP